GLKFYVARDASAPINGGTIMEYTYTGVTLPVEFISFKGEVLPSGQVRLDWEAVTDNLHDYFEVERSSNGIQFSSIGRGPDSAPFSFIDVAPFSGSNYYRVKQVDLDGTVTYSTVIHIITNAGRLIVSAFPNPTSDVINVTTRAAEADRFYITLTDLNGRTVYEEKLVMPVNALDRTIRPAAHASQLYILVVRNGKNEIVSSQRIARTL